VESSQLYHLVVEISKDFACLEAEKGTHSQIRLLKAVVDNACKLYNICTFESITFRMEHESARLVAVEVVGHLVFLQNLNKLHQRILGMIKSLPDSFKACIKAFWIEKLNSVESFTAEISKLHAGHSFLLFKGFEDVHHVCSLQIWKRCISILEFIKQDGQLQHHYQRDCDIDLCKEAASLVISSYQACVKADEYDSLVVRSYTAILDLLQVNIESLYKS